MIASGYAVHAGEAERVAIGVMDWLPIANFGINAGALSAVLLLLANGRLVARSWADALVKQANSNAETALRMAFEADRRADLFQTAMVEQTAALRAVETLVRSQGMGYPMSPPGPRGPSSSTGAAS